ncbi:MAG: hypothetical protein MUF54_16675 [Polyangiaceae bacterium]|jgi:hypothetical protein|nr:hypothetical protein [Polyangiaceae bacterium]
MQLAPRFGLISLLALAPAAIACSSADVFDTPPQDTHAADTPPQDTHAADTPDSGTPVEQPDAAQFASANFEACVRAALERPDGDLFPDAFAGLTHLECQDSKITNIAGIEHATELVDLSLWENQITDLSPLAALTKLEDLQLGLNQIEDLTPLTKLTSLKRLGLSINKISALQPLAGLTELEWLNLDNNAIADGELVHLSRLTKLRWLTLEHNGIQDFSAVEPLGRGGCDLYGNAVPAKAMPRLSLSGASAKVPHGTLELSISSAGQVAMRYRTAAGKLPVRRVFAGKLTAERGRVLYENRGLKVQVGTAGPHGQSLCTGDFANICKVRIGRKGQSLSAAVPGMGIHPVITIKIELLDETSHTLVGPGWGVADHDVEQFALASPNQFDAGSCLFMANAGAMEILMNQHTPLDRIEYGGDTDLSERYLMNAAGYKTPASEIPYDLTDTLYAYNYFGGALLNRDYPFCAGYVKENANGSISASTASDPDAYLSCSYNWINKLPDNWKDLLVPTPPAERTLIFVDAERDENSQWRVGLFDDDTIEKIKHELRTKNAPVLLVYNHFLYWHANIVVGYDDTESTGGGCPFVQDSIAYFKKEGATSYATKIEQRMAELGGCRDTGVFYVRDSIYDGDDEPTYDYSTEGVQLQKERYSDRIVKLEYDFAKYLGNHTYTVHRK